MLLGYISCGLTSYFHSGDNDITNYGKGHMIVSAALQIGFDSEGGQMW